MRLIITGKSRSGKSTALHRLIRTARTTTWASLLMADGKSVELTRYAGADLRVYGEDEIEDFAAALTATADRLTTRYKALRGRGLTAALPGDPRELIIVDEIQEFTRHAKHGKTVKAALTRIFEKSGALGDVVIIATQRATAAIPPSARVNASAELRMLSLGYFQLAADGFPTRQGRVDRQAPLALPSALTPEALPRVLSTQAVEHEPTTITRYEGMSGSGRTYALEHHLSDPAYRRVFLDLKMHSHRSLLVHCLRTCGATPSPTRTRPPSIHLRFTLPPSVNLSALRVRAGDTITEGQTLAAWPSTEPTPHPSATPPPMPTLPAATAAPITDSSASRALHEAQAALPGGDLAIVVLPARTGHDGEVALWWVGNDAPQVRPLPSLDAAPITARVWAPVVGR